MFRIFVLLLLVLLTPEWLSAQLPAFPGAAGYGRFATGGRGNGATGRVAIVTTLEDDVDNPPEGSFRWAVQQGVETVINPIFGEMEVKRPLTIVFEVGGVIELQGDLRVNRNDLTIAGQTAPGDGICFSGATINFGGSQNLIVRYIRSRPGDEAGDNTDGFRLENGGNFIIDHCSFSWAIEETTHFSSNRNTTVQYCIISESLYNSVHHKGARGYATQWGGEYASYHHNLLAHHNSRMPRINGSNSNDIESLVDYRNNVHYNWRSNGAFYGGEWEATAGRGFSSVNVVNNYFIPGPATSNPIFARPSLNRTGVDLDGYAKWYFDGNVMEGNAEMTADNWKGVDVQEVGSKENIYAGEVQLKTADIDGLPGELEDYASYTETADDALETVLASVGSSFPVRDVIDARVIAELMGEVPIVRYRHESPGGLVSPLLGLESGLIDTPMNLLPENEQVSGAAWKVYRTVSADQAPIDTDRDGIPDAWELQFGLDPNDPGDSKELHPETGYSYLEMYLFDLIGEEVSTSLANGSRSISSVQILSNPVREVLSFQAEDWVVEAEILGLSGQKLLRTAIKGQHGTLGVRTLPAGVYVLKVRFLDGRQSFRKFVKQ